MSDTSIIIMSSISLFSISGSLSQCAITYMHTSKDLTYFTEEVKTMTYGGKMKSQGPNRVHPLGNTNVCTKFHGSPTNSCRDISVWTKVVDRSGFAIPSVEPYH